MRKRYITVAIHIDGLGWRLANEHGFLDDELRFRGPLATTFGPTSSSLPTILTGATPREHGHFAPFTYDPGQPQYRRLGWTRRVPKWLARNRGLRLYLQRQAGLGDDFQLHNAPLELLPLMKYTEGRDLTQPGAVRGGLSTLFDDMREADVRFKAYLCGPDVEKLRAARRDFTDGDMEFAYLRLTGLSEFLHTHGTRSTALAGQLHKYERQICELLSTAREYYDEVKVALFSANGVADITGECDLMRQIEALPLRAGEDYFAIYDSTMARFWFLTERAREMIGAALAHSLDGQWLSENTLRLWGCDFPGQSYGQRFFLLRPGVLLNPSYMARGSRAGMHGYDPWHKDSVAFFACNDPGMGRPAGLANLRDLLTSSVGVFRLAQRSA